MSLGACCAIRSLHTMEATPLPRVVFLPSSLTQSQYSQCRLNSDKVCRSRSWVTVCTMSHECLRFPFTAIVCFSVLTQRAEMLCLVTSSLKKLPFPYPVEANICMDNQVDQCKRGDRLGITARELKTPGMGATMVASEKSCTYQHK